MSFAEEAAFGGDEPASGGVVVALSHPHQPVRGGDTTGVTELTDIAGGADGGAPRIEASCDRSAAGVDRATVAAEMIGEERCGGRRRAGCVDLGAFEGALDDRVRGRGEQWPPASGSVVSVGDRGAGALFAEQAPVIVDHIGRRHSIDDHLGEVTVRVPLVAGDHGTGRGGGEPPAAVIGVDRGPVGQHPISVVKGSHDRRGGADLTWVRLPTWSYAYVVVTPATLSDTSWPAAS